MAKKMEETKKVTPGVRMIVNDCQNEFTVAPGFQFTEFYLLTDCNFSILRGTPEFSIEGFEGRILPAGTTLKINALSFKLNSGNLLAYFQAIDEKVTVN